MRPDPFDPENFPTEEELEEQAERELARRAEGIEKILSARRTAFDEKLTRIEVDITGLDFDAVARTIEMMPGGCVMVRDADGRIFIQGFDPEFVVWGALQQGYIKGRK